MLFREVTNSALPTVILLHGGGLSNWSLASVVALLQDDYSVITPIIDGHGDDGAETFISIEDSARKLLEYIDAYCGGKVFAIGGLSIGGQIVSEVLSQRDDVAQYAILESTLALPMKGIAALTGPMYKLFYGLIKKRWFSKMQAKSLFVPKAMFEQYYADSLKISRESLVNITLSNGNYRLKKTIEKTTAKVLIIVGEREIGIMRKSAQLLSRTIPGSRLYCAKRMRHGELSLACPKQYVTIVKQFFAR